MWLKGAGVPANVSGAWGPLLGLDSCRFVLEGGRKPCGSKAFMFPSIPWDSCSVIPAGSSGEGSEFPDWWTRM